MEHNYTSITAGGGAAVELDVFETKLPPYHCERL